MPVYEIERDMPSAEVYEWQAHFELKEEERKQAEKRAKKG